MKLKMIPFFVAVCIVLFLIDLNEFLFNEK